ncbi:condensation domain-containing protein [Streptomyces sp. NPDC045470]|uniref:condensation domain-containing protein n=1 Tax=Streptomyces sp. NPDC045470 TaxID=3155469 RepID=UPI0033D0D961
MMPGEWSMSAPDDPLQSLRSSSEPVLCEMFASLFGLVSVDVDADFFDMGGNSVLATRLVSQVQTVFPGDVTFGDLFENPTPRSLAKVLDQAVAASPRPRSTDRPAMIPLSPGQSTFWFYQQLRGPSADHNIVLSLKLIGPLDRDALAWAFDRLIDRHEILRTVFPRDQGEPHQVVLDPAAARPGLRFVDVAGHQISAELTKRAALPFDVTTEPALRAWLLVISPDEHVLLISLHHIAGDGWSTAPLWRDLSAAYLARRDRLPWQPQPLAVQYADYSIWKQDLMDRESDGQSIIARQARYWTQTLADLPEELPLPVDRPRPARLTARADGVPFTISPDAHRRLLAQAADARVTLLTTLRAAVAVLLAKLGGGSDIPIGGLVSGRTAPGLDDAIGFFVNTQVLRCTWDGDPTFETLIPRVREAEIGAYANQDMPFGRIVDLLNPDRLASRHPLFQVMVVLEERHGVDRDIFGCVAERQEVDHLGLPMFDLSFNFFLPEAHEDTDAGMAGWLGYSPDLFDRSTVEHIADCAVYIIDALTAKPTMPLSELAVPLPVNTRLARRAAVDFTVPVTANTVTRPRTPRLDALCGAFAQTLGAEEVGADDNFFGLGGHSLMAVRLVSRIRSTLGTELPVRVVFDQPTPAGIDRWLEQADAGSDTSGPAADGLEAVLRIRPDGDRTPVFLIPPAIGLSWCYTPMSRWLADGFPIYGLQARGICGAEPVGQTLTDIATGFVDELRRIQQNGPYQLLGWSSGGNVAHAMAVMLEADGEEVSMLALLDSYPWDGEQTDPALDVDPAEADVQLTTEELRRVLQASPGTAAAIPGEHLPALARVFASNRSALLRHRSGRFGGDVLLFTAAESVEQGMDPSSWQKFVEGRLKTWSVSGNHYEVLGPEPLETIMTVINAELTADHDRNRVPAMQEKGVAG